MSLNNIVCNVKLVAPSEDDMKSILSDVIAKHAGQPLTPELKETILQEATAALMESVQTSTELIQHGPKGTGASVAIKR